MSSSAAPRIALVSAAGAIALDEDLVPLLRALRERGAHAEVVCWDEPAADWSAFDLALVRSTWDYSGRRGEFLGWARRAAAQTRLHNRAPVLEWNTDKHYLAELASRGAPVVETWFLEPGQAAVLPDRLEELVVKPTVSAGAKDTARYQVRRSEEREEALCHLRSLLEAGRGAMVQPYLAQVEGEGETALVYIRGQLSHAVRKGPLLPARRRQVTGLFAPEEIAPRLPRADEVEVGERALRALAGIPGLSGQEPLLYARVDLIRDESGAPRLLELEVTEPSLFLDAASAARLAEAVLGCLLEPAERQRGRVG
jgi:O-ureido-D-serine cyclo-ligase